MGAPRNFTKDEIEMIRSMTEQGCTQAAIAEALNTSNTTIRYHQNKLGLKASNKWHFGESVKKDGEIFDTTKPVKQKPKEQYLIVTEKTVNFHGAKTGFNYVVNSNAKGIVINTGYCEPLEIDLKDLVSFGNEILDIADEITKMKANVFEV